VGKGEISAAFPAGAKNASYDKDAQHLHKQHLICDKSPNASLCMHVNILHYCTAALLHGCTAALLHCCSAAGLITED
jgi:hypothetical protein